MPLIDSIRLGGASSADAAFSVDRSLRFNDDDSAFITRTPSSDGNRRKWTLSLWFKRGNLGSNQNLFSTSGTDDRGFFDARFQSNDTLTIGIYTNYVLQTNQVFRDPSAWYHMVIVLDSGQGSASDRLKLYINGSEVTSFSLDNRATFITVNQSFGINSTNAFEIGRHALDANKYFDGYIAEINFIDGQALTPSSFGETNSTTGQWNPKEYEGTYAKTGSASNGTTWVSGSSNNNNQVEANAFNGIPTSSAADAGSMYQTPLNGSYTLTPSTSFTVNSNLSFQMYANVANFNTYSSVFVNGSEVTMSLVTGTNQSTNDGVWSSNFTGTVNNFGLSSHPTSINAIAQVIVDGEVLINGFNDNGKNSFYLQFADNSGTSATTLGKDTSGQSNNFTPNNFSVAAGAGNDSLEDTPTNNFCTLNAIALGQGNELRATISNGSLDFTESSSNNRTAVSTFGLKTGKWYFEFLCTNTGTFSIGWHDMENNQGSFYRNNGSYSSSFGGGGTFGYSSWTTNDIVGVAIDFDSGKIWYAKNNTWQSGDPATGNSPTNTFTTGKTLHTEAFCDNSSGTKSGSFNYGQRAFTYTPPTGYKSICSKNLSNPTVLLPNKHFETVLYTGNGNSTGSQTSVLEFQPDWLWTKARTATYVHLLYDAVRGAGNSKSLNLAGGYTGTGAEGSAADNTTYGFLNSFDANGFSYTKGSAGTTFFNQSGINYVAWNWDAGEWGNSAIICAHTPETNPARREPRESA